jgi:GNAT superfamily N-acetyltransferase
VTIVHGEGLPNRAAHPEHEALHLELQRWFRTSEPALDYVVTKHWYGYLSELRSVLGARLILTIDDPGDLAAALEDARRRSSGAVTIWVDDRERYGHLDHALRASGCLPGKSVAHLALVGELTARPGPASLVVHDVDLGGLEEWVVAKLKCFGDTEAAPSDEQIAREMRVRAPELALARLQLARLEGDAVGVLAFYAGPDQLVFNLGTRVAFRHRGIAQQLLSDWVAAGRAQGCRSLMINADHLGAPEALYKRIGFVDEVYWYQGYELDPDRTRSSA